MACTVEEIEEIFARNLPSVSTSAAFAFASGMHMYYEVFSARREGDMNYEKAADYFDGLNEIMEVGEDDFFIYTPHFKKILGLTIGKLFKTKITMLGSPGDVKKNYSLFFVDDHKNRWNVSARQSESDPLKVRICARFPIAGTKIHMTHASPASEIHSPSFNPSGKLLCVLDAQEWHKEGG